MDQKPESKVAQLAGAFFSTLRDPAVMAVLLAALNASREQAARNSFAGRARSWLEVLREPLLLATVELLVYTAIGAPKPPTPAVPNGTTG